MATPTDEQRDIINAALTRANLVINAGAGTGKTTSLQMVAEQLGGRGLYLAYNRTTAQDARARFPRTTQCMTAHAIAYSKIVKGTGRVERLRAGRMPPVDQARILGVTGPTLLAEGFKAAPWQMMRFINGTVRAFCNSADTRIGRWHVPVLPGLEEARSHVERIIVPLAARAWTDLLGESGELPLSHDCYLKQWALTSPQAEVDYVMMDEGQDANPCTAGIVLGQRDTQTIVTGDACQAIYAWRGAVDVMDTWPAQHRLNLSQSWRFGQYIADEANRWLTLLNADLRLTGNPALASRLDKLKTPDAVLCRTNAGAMSEAMAALEAGRRPAIVGGGEDLRKLAEAAIQLKERGRTTHPDLYLFTSWGQIQDLVDQDKDAGADLKVAVSLIDQYGPEELIKALGRLSPEATADVVMSTAHRGKGREWGQVRIGDDFTAPQGDDGEPGKPSRSEGMLAYVAVTRAQYVLDRGSLELIDQYVPSVKPADVAT